MDNPVSVEQLQHVATRPAPLGGTTTEHQASVETLLVSIAFDLRRITDCANETNASLKEIGEKLDNIGLRLAAK